LSPNDAAKPVVCTETGGNNGRGGNRPRVLVTYNPEDDGKCDPYSTPAFALVRDALDNTVLAHPDSHHLFDSMDSFFMEIFGGGQRMDPDTDEGGKMTTRNCLDDLDDLDERENDSQDGEETTNV